ncbi:hypothetical protein [Enterobacter sp. CC120223-11]|uniref:hypothetical protein n=1 Tax=Enterobacter sp. CC120223-11 TaxID=1378073 RepID=UPI000BCCA1DA|nr:hypothetical protein [Enterobacter sp. CC120223-11]SNY65696.1 hypothetical protein SAMN02744775_01389 [Enterobacter sp. CC120223-11]
MKITLGALFAVSVILLVSSGLTQAAERAAAQHSTAAAATEKPSLDWRAEGEILTVTNRGSTAIHLERNVRLMPDEMPLTLNKTTLQPGETLQVFGACPHHLPLQKEVVVTLQSPEGKPGREETLVLHHR